MTENAHTWPLEPTVDLMFNVVILSQSPDHRYFNSCWGAGCYQPRARKVKYHQEALSLFLNSFFQLIQDYGF